MMEELDFDSLLTALATVDILRREGTKNSKLPVLEQLIYKKENTKVKSCQEIGHQMPHLQIDYGRNNHVASYALDIGVRIEGDLDKKYDQ